MTSRDPAAAALPRQNENNNPSQHDCLTECPILLPLLLSGDSVSSEDGDLHYVCAEHSNIVSPQAFDRKSVRLLVGNDAMRQPLTACALHTAEIHYDTLSVERLQSIRALTESKASSRSVAVASSPPATILPIHEEMLDEDVVCAPPLSMHDAAPQNGTLSRHASSSATARRTNLLEQRIRRRLRVDTRAASLHQQVLSAQSDATDSLTEEVISRIHSAGTVAVTDDCIIEAIISACEDILPLQTASASAAAAASTSAFTRVAKRQRSHAATQCAGQAARDTSVQVAFNMWQMSSAINECSLHSDMCDAIARLHSDAPPVHTCVLADSVSGGVQQLMNSTGRRFGCDKVGCAVWLLRHAPLTGIARDLLTHCAKLRDHEQTIQLEIPEDHQLRRKASVAVQLRVASDTSVADTACAAATQEMWNVYSARIATTDSTCNADTDSGLLDVIEHLQRAGQPSPLWLMLQLPKAIDPVDYRLRHVRWIHANLRLCGRVQSANCCHALACLTLAYRTLQYAASSCGMGHSHYEHARWDEEFALLHVTYGMCRFWSANTQVRVGSAAHMTWQLLRLLAVLSPDLPKQRRAQPAHVQLLQARLLQQLTRLAKNAKARDGAPSWRPCSVREAEMRVGLLAHSLVEYAERTPANQRNIQNMLPALANLRPYQKSRMPAAMDTTTEKSRDDYISELPARRRRNISSTRQRDKYVRSATPQRLLADLQHSGRGHCTNSWPPNSTASLNGSLAGALVFRADAPAQPPADVATTGSSELVCSSAGPSSVRRQFHAPLYFIDAAAHSNERARELYCNVPLQLITCDGELSVRLCRPAIVQASRAATETYARCVFYRELLGDGETAVPVRERLCEDFVRTLRTVSYCRAVASAPPGRVDVISWAAAWRKILPQQLSAKRPRRGRQQADGEEQLQGRQSGTLSADKVRAAYQQYASISRGASTS